MGKHEARGRVTTAIKEDAVLKGFWDGGEVTIEELTRAKPVLEAATGAFTQLSFEGRTWVWHPVKTPADEPIQYEEPAITPSGLPLRVIVDQHGHYWRDFGDYLSMPPVSDENTETVTFAVYVPESHDEPTNEQPLAGEPMVSFDPTPVWREGLHEHEQFDIDLSVTICLGASGVPSHLVGFQLQVPPQPAYSPEQVAAAIADEVYKAVSRELRR